LVLALVALSLPASADTFPVVETTIADIEAAYQSGAATPDDVVRAYLRRINQYDRTDSPQPINGGQGNQPLHSYMRVNPHAQLAASLPALPARWRPREGGVRIQLVRSAHRSADDSAGQRRPSGPRDRRLELRSGHCRRRQPRHGRRRNRDLGIDPQPVRPEHD